MNLTGMLTQRFRQLSWSKRDQYIIAVIAFLIPFGIRLLPYLIVLLGLSWLFTGGIKRTVEYFFYPKKRNRIFLFLPILFYFFHLLSLLVTENLRIGAFDIQVKLSFLLIPLFLTGIHRDSIDLDKVLNSFLAGTIIASILCYFIAAWNSLGLDSGRIIFDVHPDVYFYENFFLYDRFSAFHHPSYFAMFILFAIGTGFYYLQSDKNNIFGNRFIVISIFFLSLTLFLLSSRAGFLVWLVLIVTFGLTHIHKRASESYKLAFPFVILIGFFSFLIINGNRYNTVIEDFKVYKNYAQENTQSSIGTRVVLWEESVWIIKRNFIFGVGQGDIKMELFRQAKKQGYLQIIEKNLNIHNQFLETFIGLGIGGIILLVMMLFWPILKLRGKYLKLFVYFIIIVSLNLVFESMFNRLAGVFFFMFFYCLLTLVMNQQPSSRLEK
ncbi:hypothetical protein ES705_32148 [subsurface metagenome]